MKVVSWSHQTLSIGWGLPALLVLLLIAVLIILVAMAQPPENR
jgi:hypothetical protein